jgi:hypothetical protein
VRLRGAEADRGAARAVDAQPRVRLVQISKERRARGLHTVAVQSDRTLAYRRPPISSM